MVTVRQILFFHSHSLFVLNFLSTKSPFTEFPSVSLSNHVFFVLEPSTRSQIEFLVVAKTAQKKTSFALEFSVKLRYTTSFPWVSGVLRPTSVHKLRIFLRIINPQNIT